MMTYDEDSQKNEQQTGTRLSPMTWGIVPKIREVDKFFDKNRFAVSCVKEVHPELCFWALAGRPMRHNKKRTEGFAERIKVLESYYSATEDIVQHSLINYRRKAVAKDDILDALVAAITAQAGLNALVSIPYIPEFDKRRLHMQMLYRPTTAR